MQKNFCETWGLRHYEYFSVAKMKFFVTFQLSFLERTGLPHKNEMLLMEIGMSTYCYTQKICVGVRVSWDRDPQSWDFYYFIVVLGYGF